MGGVYYLSCACTLGFLCLENSALPNFCPKKYFCRDPGSVKECKEGHYCKEGSVYGRRCFLARCPKGSVEPEGALGMSGTVIFVAFTLFVFVVFQIYERYADFKARREYIDMEDYLEEMRVFDNNNNHNSTPLITVDDDDDDFEEEKKTTEALLLGSSNDFADDGDSEDKENVFVIDYEDLCYSLPNGVSIVENVSGRFAPATTTAIMGSSGAGKSKPFLSFTMI